MGKPTTSKINNEKQVNDEQSNVMGKVDVSCLLWVGRVMEWEDECLRWGVWETSRGRALQ